jgi:hypothetical protein
MGFASSFTTIPILEQPDPNDPSPAKGKVAEGRMGLIRPAEGPIEGIHTSLS